MIQSILFLIVLLTAAWFIRKRVLHLRRNIKLGKAADIRDRVGDRLKNMLLVAFGQKKMFKRIAPAFLHVLI